MLTKKLTLFLTTGLVATSLLLGGCSTEKSETIYTENGKAYTTNDLVSDTQEEFSKNVFQQTIAYKLLNKDYHVTEKEIETRYKEEAAQFESLENFEAELLDYGTTPELYKKDIRNAIALEKALVDLNNVNETAIKKRYQEVKTVHKALLISVEKPKSDKDKATYDKALAKVEKDLKNKMDYAGFLKKYSDATNVYIATDDYVIGQTDSSLSELFKLKKHEYTTVKESSATTFIQLVDTYEGDYGDMKESIRNELGTTGKYQTLGDVYKALAKRKGITFENKYKTLGSISKTDGSADLDNSENDDSAK